MSRVNLSITLSCFLATAVFAGCGNSSPQDQIKTAVRAHLNAMQKHDLKAICETSTWPPYASCNEAMAGWIKEDASGKPLSKDDVDKEVNKTFTERTLKINGETATLTPKPRMDGAVMSLRKINGQWKVDYAPMLNAMGSQPQ